MVKKVLVLLAGVVIGGSLVFGYNLNQNKKTEIKIIREINKSEEGIYLEDGDIFGELSDGSYYIKNNKNGKYIFQVVDLGDWDYEVETEEDLNNIIKTYINIKNNGTY